MSEKFSRVRLYFRKDTGHYYALINASDGDYELDLGTDEENLEKVKKLLIEELGGIYVPPGGMN